MYKIGVAGYSSGEFNTQFVRNELNELYSVIERFYANGKDIAIVSGLTNVGVPALAYEVAVDKGMTTVGIACARASEYEVFPVNIRIIEGSEWGDESEKFISYIDALICFGNGEQSLAELAMFRELKPKNPVFEVELERK